MRTMIHQAIDDYIVFLTVEKGASHNTIEAYSNDVRKFAQYLEDSEIHRWNQVDNSTIRGYMATM
ncbi:MAG: site-specific integrase, partial [Peptococcaceae bacterium]|nr:site-specific integrase [Peptococcaceae bacterium]